MRTQHGQALCRLSGHVTHGRFEPYQATVRLQRRQAKALVRQVASQAHIARPQLRKHGCSEVGARVPIGHLWLGGRIDAKGVVSEDAFQGGQRGRNCRGNH